MAKLLEIQEAAARLGITPEKLLEMREKGDVAGVRAGTSWKFKEDEINRVQEEGLLQGGGDSDYHLNPMAFDDDDDNSSESVLVSEEELGHSGESTSSTIIGKMGDKEAKPDSDLKLQSHASSLTLLPDANGESDLVLSDADSDVELVPGKGSDSDVSLIPAAKTDLKLTSSKSDVLSGGTDLQLKSLSGTGTGSLGQRASDINVGSSDLELHMDSGLALADDDELVIGGSGIGSDVTLGGSDSGINLSSPTDSGLSLEDEPLNLTGSSAISSLELPEDEDALTLDEGAADDAAPKQDEEFLLSPSGEILPDEADSGSQVIALEPSSDGLGLDAVDFGGIGASGLEADAAPLDSGFSPTTGMMPGPMGMQMGYAAQEAPYTTLQCVGLGGVLLLLCMSAMMMADVVRNMWSWDQKTAAVSSIAEGLTGMFGK